MRDGYNDRTVAVVDGYGSGRLLAPAFRSRGYDVVHVRNVFEQQQSATGSYRASDYVEEVCFSNLADTVDALVDRRVAHVVVGHEGGSTIAHQLARALGSPTANEERLAVASRDKRTMHRLVFEHGLAIPRQEHLDAAGDVVWSTDLTRLTSGVVKPPASAGTQGVRVCSDAAELNAAIAAVRGESNLFGRPNDGVVVQEHLPGAEYMINSVSATGRHTVVEVWRSDKVQVDDRPVYDRQVLETDLESAIVRQVIEYTRTVLDVLGVRWGPCHTELILTSGGPVLLEVGTRLPGGLEPAVGLATTGMGMVDETAQAYLAPNFFVARGTERRPALGAMGVSLMSTASGVLTREPDRGPLHRLPSFVGMRMLVGVGDRVERTDGLHSRPGGLYLCHADAGQLESDYREVRRWEREHLVTVIAPDDAAERAEATV